MITEFTDDVLKTFLRGTRNAPLEGLTEYPHDWSLYTFSLSRARPSWSNGFSFALGPDSRLYKRWFDYPDLDKRGWVILFRVFEPADPDAKNFEQIPGWVPPEREPDADAWIEFLNAEIRDRLAGTSRASHTDELIKMNLLTSRKSPLQALEQSDGMTTLGTVTLCEHNAAYDSHPLGPDSLFYKKRFEVAERDARGWAVVLRFARVGDLDLDVLAGWVPPEREAEADGWIELLNTEVRRRLDKP